MSVFKALRDLFWQVLKGMPRFLFQKLFRCPHHPAVEHRTVDGGRLCPHPGMTDADLDDYEREFDVPGRKR